MGKCVEVTNGKAVWFELGIYFFQRGESKETPTMRWGLFTFISIYSIDYRYDFKSLLFCPFNFLIAFSLI